MRVSATRPILFGLRELGTTVAVDVEVRLDPPRLAVASTFHYVNHGGAEAVVYTVSPPDAASGVRVSTTASRARRDSVVKRRAEQVVYTVSPPGRGVRR